jgi:bifunctional UDP-N-acetylglucosamine pyrophosphorylase/glucosamine-1-phosphate N-acetyltransferase
MEPLSTVTPKPMLPVGDRPLIAHVADAAIEAGSDELIIVVGYKADHIRSYFGDHYGGVPVRYAEQPTAAGTADAVKRASPMLDGRFAVLNGDSLFDTPSLTELFTHEAGVAAHRVDQPGEYGVLSTDHGIATEVVEKPDDPPTNLANAGAYVFPEAALTALDVPESERGEREITDVLSWLIDRMDVAIVETDQWLDVARPADLLRANELAVSDTSRRIEGQVDPEATIVGNVEIAEGATIESGATIRGPVIVARDATVQSDAVLEGPSVVGANATIREGVELARTVLLPGSEVNENVRLRGLVFGPRCALPAGVSVAGGGVSAADGVATVSASEPATDEGLSY